MEIQKPTQGRVVNYHNHQNGETHTATICKVWSDECVNLSVINHNGEHYAKTSVMKDNPDITQGTWSWPTRN